MKQKKEKSLIDKVSMFEHKEFLKSNEIPYTLIISNYTTEIQSEVFNVQFLQSMRNKSCFSAYNHLMKDVKDKQKPVVDKSRLQYFNHNFKKNEFHSEVWQIDLKSAYATVLFNDGVISETTMQYLSKIEKLDRLASVGMLASKKHVFSYDAKGKLISYDKKVSEYENFFYYCVKRVDEIMHHLRWLSQDSYLFTWVDALYIKPNEERLSDILTYLEEINFKHSIDVLNDFTITVSNKIRLQYNKGENKKYFYIPSAPSTFANDVIDFLTDKEETENETSIFKNFRRTNSGNSNNVSC